MKPPQQWKKLVVPTDFSACSQSALQTAAGLRETSGAEVLLLHVTEPAYEGLRVQTSNLHEEMRHAAETKLKQLAAETFPDTSDVRVIIKEGRPADTICRTAVEEAADAIIMPTHGHSGLVHVLLGSVTEKVVRHSPCSVLVVR